MRLYRESRFSIGGEAQILWVLLQQERVQWQRDRQLRESLHDEGGALPHVGHQYPGQGIK